MLVSGCEYTTSHSGLSTLIFEQIYGRRIDRELVLEQFTLAHRVHMQH